jgi:hypothetical protein
MGDRGIAVLKFPPEYGADLAVYSHWAGSTLYERVAMIRDSEVYRDRAGDVNYAARIMVDQLTKSSRDDSTGYGVWPFAHGTDPLHDDGDVVVTIDLKADKIVPPRADAANVLISGDPEAYEG